MEKQLKDYLPYYLGCEVQYPDTDGKTISAKLTGFSLESGAETTYKRKRNGVKGDYIGFKDGKERGHDTYVENMKIKLRSLYSITKEEVAMLLNIEVNAVITKGNFSSPFFQIEYIDDNGEITFEHQYLTMLSPDQVYYLLSKYLDIFGLIEAGLALDATKTT